MGMDEIRGLAVVLGRSRAIAARRRHHRHPFKAIVHVGVAREEILRGLFRLVEAARVDEIDHTVGRLIEAVVLVGGEQGRGLLAFERAGAYDGSGFVTWQAAALIFLSAAAGTRIIASGLGHGTLWR